MPERWQRELSKLGHLKAPEMVWERAQHGSSGDPLPPRRERVVAGVVASTVFIAAAAFAWRALAPAATSVGDGGSGAASQVVLTFLADGRELDPNVAVRYRPAASLTVKGTTILGAIGSYGWDVEGGGNLISDAAMPEFAEEDFLAIPSGVELAVRGDATGVRAALGETEFPFDAVVEIDLSANPVILDAEPGRYVLVAQASWADGGAPFYFPVDIVGAVEPSPATPAVKTIRDVLPVRCGDTGIELLSPIVAAQSDGVHIAVENVGDREFTLAVEAAFPQFNSRVSLGYQGPPGEVTEVVAAFVGPGQEGTAIGCDTIAHEPASRVVVGGTVPFQVVDAAGYFVPHAPACETEGIRASVTIDYQPPISPQEFVEATMKGIRPSDSVERAGYVPSEVEHRFVRIVRGESIVASFWLRGDPQGWNFDAAAACVGSGIGGA